VAQTGPACLKSEELQRKISMFSCNSNKFARKFALSDSFDFVDVVRRRSMAVLATSESCAL
jgi:hypothetical protein